MLGLVDPPGRVVGGNVLFEGRDITKLPEADWRQLRGNRIAMIFQDPTMTLNPVLRIGTQMVETDLAHKKMPAREARQRARDVLGMVGIPSPEERLAAYPHQFSGGMRQRVAIAIALLLAPRLIITDEPTTALDVPIQAQILNLFMELRSQFDLTYLFISHDLGVVEHLADRIAVVYLGRIIEEAPAPREIAPNHCSGCHLTGAP